MPALDFSKNILLLTLWSACLPACLAAADEYIHRVAVIAHSPPLSYTDQDGRLTGFNVEIARELCTAMNVRCTLQPMPIEKIFDEFYQVDNPERDRAKSLGLGLSSVDRI
ncbi:MAG: transporter substrate-binding domain-containing protein, partial [Rhodoferax sp.]